MYAAIERARYKLFNDQFVPWKLHPRDSAFEPSLDSPKTYIQDILIEQHDHDPTKPFGSSLGDLDESYTLSITDSGRATITANTTNGIVYALESLTQLFYTHSQSSTGVYTPFAPVEIADKPKFAYRGLNMDVARNFFPVSEIKHAIDALSWNKFNRLHLHASDAQSWPIEIPALPKLALNGAYRVGLSYSPDDLKMIQEYGASRAVEVIIEIDMPGHTYSIALSYPDLIVGPNIQPWSQYAAEPPSGQLKLKSPAVYDFLNKLWKDLLPRVSPYSSHFHTGGDEVNVNIYKLEQAVGSNDTAIIKPLLQKLVDFNHAKVRAAGLIPVVWEEMLLFWNLTLGSDVLVQTWQSDDALSQTVAKGHKALAGNFNDWYLDCGKGQWLDFPLNSTQAFYPFADYCSPIKNWRLIYSYDPLDAVPKNATHLVLGGEVHIWAEQTDGVNFDDMVWPRASAAGEVLWSGAKTEAGLNRSQVEASPRLAEWRERMVHRGVKAGPIQPVFCTQMKEQCNF